MSACRPRGWRLAALAIASAALSACAGAGRAGSPAGAAAATPAVSPSLTPGPEHAMSSPVRVTLVSPRNDEVIAGSTLHVAVSVTGGTISPTYSTTVSPTVGHVHVYLDNQLAYMSYSTEADLPVDPGAEYSLYAEWVASDHGSFTPRDLTPKIYFAVSP